MKRYKYISIALAMVSVLLSNVMCVYVTYRYCHWRFNVLYSENGVAFRAFAYTQLIYAVPFLLGILLSSIAALLLYRRYKRGI